MHDIGTYPVYGASGIVGFLDHYEIEEDAILIIKDGSGVGTVFSVSGKCSATSTMNILQPKEGYSLKYLYYALKAFKFDQFKTGMAIPHIYFKDFGKGMVYCGTFAEQQKIAQCISVIDKKLDAERQLSIELLKQKAFFLQKLFI